MAPIMGHRWAVSFTYASPDGSTFDNHAAAAAMEMGGIEFGGSPLWYEFSVTEEDVLVEAALEGATEHAEMVQREYGLPDWPLRQVWMVEVGEDNEPIWDPGGH